jgi:hypothetical protein
MKPRREIVELGGERVTIDDILKDDPKALANLKELREQMEKNLDLFTYPKDRTTQGTKKIKQLIEDARRDARFVKEVAKIATVRPPYSYRELEILYVVYRWYLRNLKAFRAKYVLKDPYHKLKESLCVKYGIDPVLFDYLRHDFINGRLEGWDFNEESSADVCVVEPQKYRDEPEDIHTFHLKIVENTEIKVYPIKIKVHRFASKRDILDFIDKQWNKISPYLSKKRKKERKLSREVLDVIWENRDKKASDISKLLENELPKVNLQYFEINKILHEEKKRRGVGK